MRCARKFKDPRMLTPQDTDYAKPSDSPLLTPLLCRHVARAQTVRMGCASFSFAFLEDLGTIQNWPEDL